MHLSMTPEEAHAHRIATELINFLAQKEIPKKSIQAEALKSKSLSTLYTEIDALERSITSYQEHNNQLQYRMDQLNEALQIVDNLSSSTNESLLEAFAQGAEEQERVQKALFMSNELLQNLQQEYATLKKWHNDKADSLLKHNHQRSPLFLHLSKGTRAPLNLLIESLQDPVHALTLIKVFLPEAKTYKELLKKIVFGAPFIEYIAHALHANPLNVILSLALDQPLKLVDMSLNTSDSKEKAAIIKWLLQRTSYTNHGLRLLREALIQGNSTLVKLLLETGIDVNKSYNSYEETPLILFLNQAEAKKYHSESYKTILKLLIDTGAHRETRDRHRQSPLMLASTTGFINAVKILLHYKAHIDLQDANGMTALSLAAQRGHLEIIKLLLEAGANPFLADVWGHKPSTLARTKEAATLIENHIKKNSIECPICYFDIYNTQIQPLECGHTYCCNTCLLQLIDISIKDRDPLGNLICKLPGCQKPFTQKDITRVLIDKRKLSLLEEITQEQTIMRNPRGQHCPTPDCTFAYIHDKATQKTINCPKCKQSHCSQCFKAHGASLSCKQFAKKDAQEKKLLDQWSQNNDARPCPQCNTLIEKNGGCPHMTCSKCRHEFCWTCMGTYGACKCSNRW